jgi:hypothetical protein
MRWNAVKMREKKEVASACHKGLGIRPLSKYANMGIMNESGILVARLLCVAFIRNRYLDLSVVKRDAK